MMQPFFAERYFKVVFHCQRSFYTTPELLYDIKRRKTRRNQRNDESYRKKG